MIPVDLPNEVQSTKETNSVPIAEIEAKSKQQKKTAEPTVLHDSRYDKKTLNNTNLNTTLFGDVQRQDYNSRKNDQFTVQQSIDMIRNLVEELNRHGVKADIDEMNFSKSYQIIIKLDKTAE